MKKAMVLGLVLALTGAISGMAMAMPMDTQPPVFTVMAGGEALPSTVGLNRWNGAMVKRADTLEALAAEGGALPYVALGTEITFDFGGATPDSMEMTGYVLNRDGTQKYWLDDPRSEVTPVFENGAGTFQFTGNFLTLLSSDSADYGQGQSMQGFKLTCNWGENQCEYAFMLRTDAGVWSGDSEAGGKVSPGTPVRVTGTILDASMNTIQIRAEDGRVLTFSTAEADTSKCDGLTVGSGVDVFYTGEIVGENTSSATVTALIQ